MEPPAPVDAAAEQADADGAEATGAADDSDESRAAPVSAVATRGDAYYEAEAVSAMSVGANRRWRGAVSLGAGGLLAPGPEGALTISARLEHRLTARTALGLESALLVAPTADQRVAVSILATALRGVAHGRLALAFGLGAQLGRDSGLGYAVAAHVGRRIGLVLRWDGAVLSTPQGAAHRVQVTGGVELGF